MLTAATQESLIFIIINLFIYIWTIHIHKIIKLSKHIQKFQPYFRFGCHFVVLYKCMWAFVECKIISFFRDRNKYLCLNPTQDVWKEKLVRSKK